MVFNLRTPSFTESESIEDDPTPPKSLNFRTFSFTESVEDGPTPPKSFSLKELQVATGNFSKDNVVGKGGFSIVYRGRLADGSLVAVKRARCVARWSEERFEAKVQAGSTVSAHPNVLCLRGFCRTKKELLLVYPWMINNTLSYNLTERPDRFARPLDWTTRKQIALGVARGLAHLHNQGNIKIMHGNIWASNILLNVHFEAVIGGFSRALIMHERNVGEGTIEPTTCMPSQSSRRCDVFAYGLILHTLISGKLMFEICQLVYDENLNFVELIGDVMNKNELGRVMDPNLQGNYVEEEAKQLVRLELLCTRWDASARPEMSEVVRMLESQFTQQDPSRRSSWSQSEFDSTPYDAFPPSLDSTPYYSFPPSPSPSPPMGIAP